MASQPRPFKYPDQYNFPPFFSKQTNSDTNAKRVQLWRDLILAYCRHHRVFVLDINLQALSTSPLFSNAAIQRTLRPNDAGEIVQYLAAAGFAEYLPGDSNRCYVYWKKPAEWGDALWRWANDNGYMNTVMTVFEVREGDSTQGTAFQGMDQAVLLKALRCLEKEGKAAIFEAGDGMGFKLFPQA